MTMSSDFSPRDTSSAPVGTSAASSTVAVPPLGEWRRQSREFFRDVSGELERIASMLNRPMSMPDLKMEPMPEPPAAAPAPAAEPSPEPPRPEPIQTLDGAVQSDWWGRQDRNSDQWGPSTTAETEMNDDGPGMGSASVFDDQDEPPAHHDRLTELRRQLEQRLGRLD